MAESCGGCQFHKYPYKAEIPVLIDGKREKRTFTCDEDVWEVVHLLIEEVKTTNSDTGKDFDVAESVNAQIPFFACRNVLYKKEYQDDIARYIYCKDFGVSPYDGDFSKHPAKWIDKSFIIKNALAKKERKIIDGRSKNTD